jgi:hypothetical protein
MAPQSRNFDKQALAFFERRSERAFCMNPELWNNRSMTGRFRRIPFLSAKTAQVFPKTPILRYDDHPKQESRETLQ